MRDVELALRKAYLTAIDASDAGVEMYYGGAANQLDADASYILFKGITSNGNSTKSSSDMDVTVTLQVYTKALGSNNGIDCANITDAILTAILPTPGFNLDLSDFNMQCVSTELTSNNSTNWTVDSQLVYTDRVISFRHKVFIKNTN